MNSAFNELSSFISAEAEKYSIDFYTATAILFFPFLLIPLVFFFLQLPATRDLTILMCRENYPVDSFSFALWLFAGIFGVALFLKMKSIHAGKSALLLVSLASALFFLIAMEEVAWGQHLLKFRTPEYFKSINLEGDFKIQSVKGLKNNAELLRIGLGILGLIGIAMNKSVKFKFVAVPNILIGLFLVITTFAAVDLLNNYAVIKAGLSTDLRWTAEVIEMLIALSAFIYVWLLNRRIKYQPAFN